MQANGTPHLNFTGDQHHRLQQLLQYGLDTDKPRCLCPVKWPLPRYLARTFQPDHGTNSQYFQEVLQSQPSP